MKVKSLSPFRLFATPWTVAYQASPSMGLSRQEYWSGLPFPSPGDLPNPGRSLSIIIILRYILLGILLSNLKVTWSIWEDGCQSYANTTPCYIRDFSLFGFWIRSGGWSCTKLLASSLIRRAESHMAVFSLLGGAPLRRGECRRKPHRIPLDSA